MGIIYRKFKIAALLILLILTFYCWNDRKSLEIQSFASEAAKNERFENFNKVIQLEKVAKTESGLQFESIGPANFGGRTRSVLILSNDASQSTWLLANVSGGIWKTRDKGENWTNVTKGLPLLSFNNLFQSNQSPNLIFAGTGEFRGRNVGAGGGIFFSEDFGDNWQIINTTIDPRFAYINSIYINDSNEIIVCMNEVGPQIKSYMMKSQIGEYNWEIIYEISDEILEQFVADPLVPGHYLATVTKTGYLESNDYGETWELKRPFGELIGERIVLNFDGAIAYANVQSLFQHYTRVYISKDRGTTWTPTVDDNNNIDREHGQVYYNNCINVNPFNPTQIYRGGVSLYYEELDDSQLIPPSNSFNDIINDTEFLDFIFNPESTLSYESNIRILFGPERAQKAHRFTVNGGTSGVPAEDYEYLDYVEIPFEVITDAGKQLAVSFRDQNENGKFDLEPIVMGQDIPREYFYIHDKIYSQEENPDLAVQGGHEVQQVAWFSTYLLPGYEWDSDNQQLVGNISVLYQSEDAYKLSEAKKFGGYGDVSTSIHWDIHDIKNFSGAENESQVLVCTDGGLFSSEVTDYGDFSIWNYVGDGVTSTQFYDVDKVSGIDVYIGGTQDQGSFMVDTESIGLRLTGGDVNDIYIHPNTQEILASINRIDVVIIDKDLNIVLHHPLDEGVNDFIVNPTNPEEITILSRKGLYKSYNYMDSYEKIIDFGVGNGSLDINYCHADPSVIYVLQTRSILKSTDGGFNFSEIPIPNVTGAHQIYPENCNEIYLLNRRTGEPKLLVTKNDGESWNDLTNNNGFPDVSVNCFFQFPDDTERLWVGTSIGIVESLNGGRSWSLLEDFPNVIVSKIKYKESKLLIATYGLGIWIAHYEAGNITSTKPLEAEVMKVYPIPYEDYIYIETGSLSYSQIKEVVFIDALGRTFVKPHKQDGSRTVVYIGHNTNPYISMQVKLKSGQIINRRIGVF